MLGQGHLNSGVVGVFNYTCFVFFNHTADLEPLYDKDDRVPWEMQIIHFLPACCITRTSAAPALLQSWQECSFIAIASIS